MERAQRTMFYMASFALVAVACVYAKNVSVVKKSNQSDAVASSKTKAKTMMPVDPDERGGLAGGFTQQVEASTTELADQAAAIAAEMQDDSKHEAELAKAKEVADYIDRAVIHLKNNSVEKAFDDFMHDPTFATGALYLFVYDEDATTVVHGDEPSQIWTNGINDKDAYGNYVDRDIMKKAKEGGGWVTYEWRNATKITYIKEVKKGERTYVLGSGFYPHSTRDEVVNMVNGAVTFFNETVKADRTPAEAFSAMSYPMGRFVYGSLYLYALDFEGNVLAQGDVPGLIGQNAWNYRDSNGVLVNQVIVEKLKSAQDGVWVSYVSKGAPKEAYARKVVDVKGKEYFIAAGYYPDADRRKTRDLVLKGFTYFKGHGLTDAAREFTSQQAHEYKYGDLFLFIYDLKGKCLAHGKNPDFVGQEQYNLKDEDGVYYIQEFIKKTATGDSWVNIKLKHAFFSAYVKRIKIGVEEYVIGSGLYALSRYETMVLLVKSGIGFLQGNKFTQACGEFRKKDGKFSRGELQLFLLDVEGRAYVYGDQYHLTWKNLMNQKDDNGLPYIKLCINTALAGAGTVTYKLNGMQRVAYVEKVEKDGKSYVIGSVLYK